MFKTSYDFFDLNEEEKQKYDKTEVGRGYYSFRAKALARTYGDLDAPGDEKESFTSGDEVVEAVLGLGFAAEEGVSGFG